MMFAVCLCSFIFIMSSSFFGMPISGTHTVIGALLGAGLVSLGANTLNWGKLLTILLSWVISPLLAMLLCFILLTLVASWTLNTRDFSYRRRLWSIKVITALCLVIVAEIISNILGYDKNLHKVGAVAFVFGIILTRVLLVLKISQNSLIQNSSMIKHLVCAVFMPWRTDFLEMLTLSIKIEDGGK